MLSKAARAILNDPERIRQRDVWFDRLQNLYLGKEDAYLKDHVMTVDGVVGRCSDPQLPYTDPKKCVIAYLEDLACQLEESPAKTRRFVPPCVEYPAYMVHFIDKLLGADVFYKDGQWNARYLPNEVGELRMPELESDPTWRNARIAAETFLEQDVGLPLFGLPTLSSVLNIAVNLYGDRILMAMLVEPEDAKHDLDIIQAVIESTHRWYIDHIPARQLQPVISWQRTQPPGYGQLCGCTCQLVSAEMYLEFIRDKDDHLLSLYLGGGMIHLCGSHLQHVDTFAAMPHLKAVQLNDRAAADLKTYFERLRPDQMLYVNPCQEMPLERILEITGGQRTVICAPTDAPRVPCDCCQGHKA